MDIANRNILTDERNTVIGNAEVLRVALSPTGECFGDMMLSEPTTNSTRRHYAPPRSCPLPAVPTGIAGHRVALPRNYRPRSQIQNNLM
uniref:Uncharacterized protein n=1 Tax=Daphnia galeata TaxID=27404 RepID=A0A8J2RVZ1_9CRUS|nr:unnamed protein product [Daphnia galeata]